VGIEHLGREEIILLRHLVDASPDVWHRVADGWNWDQGEEVLAWIVSQYDCDRATAALVFWRASPSFYLAHADRRAVEAAAPSALDAYDLITLILERWSNGLYRRAEIAFAPDADIVAEFDAAAAATPRERWPFAVPDDLREARGGREVTSRDYIEGYPPEVWSQFEEQV
jgi:hypothetical protein